MDNFVHRPKQQISKKQKTVVKMRFWATLWPSKAVPRAPREPSETLFGHPWGSIFYLLFAFRTVLQKTTILSGASYFPNIIGGFVSPSCSKKACRRHPQFSASRKHVFAPSLRFRPFFSGRRCLQKAPLCETYEKP